MREAPGAKTVIRRATMADLETLRRFEQGIIAAERPYDPTIKSGDIQYYDIGELIVSPDAYVALAERGGAAVGCGFARKSPSRPFEEPRFHAHVGLMFVAPDHRGSGVGNAILGALKDWARAAGLTEMRLEVYPDNAPAMRAYQKSGFAPHLLEMSLRLE
jgi:GNAT superfamily N-acetyltransferase